MVKDGPYYRRANFGQCIERSLLRRDYLKPFPIAGDKRGTQRRFSEIDIAKKRTFPHLVSSVSNVISGREFESPKPFFIVYKSSEEYTPKGEVERVFTQEEAMYIATTTIILLNEIEKTVMALSEKNGIDSSEIRKRILKELSDQQKP